MVSRLGRVARFVMGAALVAVSRAEAQQVPIPAYEDDVFRAANRAPDTIAIPVRTVMQAGTYITVPIAATVAAIAGRRQLAANLLVAGTAAWIGAKLLKPFGGRERPSGVLEDVRVREDIGGDLGWPSGHTAVAGTLALVAADGLPRAPRSLLAAVVAATGFGRMYVGAHLPHDIVGGAGFAMMLSAVLPVPEPQRSNDR